MQYLRARYYPSAALRAGFPATGRFLSQDPLPLLQRYAYVGNNPANYVDPSGLFVHNSAVGNFVGDIFDPVVDYLSDPENIASTLQTVGSLGMVLTCGDQSAIVVIAYACGISTGVYIGSSIALVVMSDSPATAACHAGTSAVGVMPLSGVTGKVIAFVAGVTDEFCAPPWVHAPGSSHAGSTGSNKE